jgi:triosephosphate isomerase (TIM)
MNRIPFVAGNWKMNKTAVDAVAFVKEILPELAGLRAVERVLCPSATALGALVPLVAGTGIGLGAQNMHWEEQGAFTGELSPGMVKEWADYVILGHSERRALFAETDENVARKVHSALAHRLVPIVCVGETLAENEAGQTAAVVSRQLRAGLGGLSAEQAGSVVIAYEPVWAIGTGRAATAEGANAVVADAIRPVMRELFGAAVAEGLRVLYGGSVTGKNAAEFFGRPDIDGALVGGASLKPEFVEIARAAQARAS